MIDWPEGLRALRLMALLTIAAACFMVASVLSGWPHDAHDPHLQWYRSQTMTPQAQERLRVPYKSCCDEGDHFKTRFKLVNDGSKYGAESYQYWKDGKWRDIPPDIIKREKTPDGRPVLFISRHTGVELCFIIDEEGI